MDALRSAFKAPQGHPISTAILGAVMVEHELDILLRRKFQRKDDDTWATLVAETGPLSTFGRKIIAGYAFKLYDDKTKFDLDVIREIRNAFAHSRKIIDFDDRLVVQKLISSKTLSNKSARELQKKPTQQGARLTYVSLCYEGALRLLKWRSRAQLASNRRLLLRLQKSPLGQAVTASANPSIPMLGFNFPRSRRELTSLLPRDPQSADPKTSAPGGGILGLARLVPKTDDKTGK